MINEATLAELNNLKTEESITIKDYKIVVRSLNIREVKDYAEEMAQFISQKKQNVDMIKIFGDVSTLLGKTTSVFYKDEKIEFDALPLAFGLQVFEVWAELNFTRKEIFLQPIERALNRILKKPVSLTVILDSLSQLLSSMDTSTDPISGNLPLKN